MNVGIGQDPGTVLMVRPSCFGFNSNTAETNGFQKNLMGKSKLEVKDLAINEFNGLVKELRGNGVDVIDVDDNDEYFTPDSVFPNNWISFHEDGKIILYPMLAEERRNERKLNVFAYLNKNFIFSSEVIDLHEYELEGKYLEGTGSLILDRVNKIGFACLSARTNEIVLKEFSRLIGYEIFTFHATDNNGLPIYHTNVILSISQKIVVVCFDVINNIKERRELKEKLKLSGREIIEISFKQVEDFCGNVFGLNNNGGESLLVMSTSAFEAFTLEQRKKINEHSKIVHSPIPTIERVGGGSVRCMLAAIHLPKNNRKGVDYVRR